MYYVDACEMDCFGEQLGGFVIECATNDEVIHTINDMKNIDGRIKWCIYDHCNSDVMRELWGRNYQRGYEY